MLMATQSPLTVVVVTVLLCALDILVVTLRFITRRKLRQSIKADDWLSLASLALILSLAATLIIGVAQHALAYPTPLTSLQTRTTITDSNDKIIITARLQYIFLVISVPTLGLIKMTFVFFYRRIFVVEKQNFSNLQNIVYTAMICTIFLWSGGFLFSFIFACKGHFTAWWASASSLITNCVNTLELLYAFAISDFITDSIIILLPLPMIWKLRLPTSRKVGVTAVFLLGIFAAAASLIRMIWVIWARHVGFNPLLDEDLLITTLLFWCMVEVTLGLLAACLPTLRGLFKPHSVDSVVRSVRSKISLRSANPSSNTSLPMKSLESCEHRSSDSIARIIPAGQSLRIMPATYTVGSAGGAPRYSTVN
ncbi:hypothetical protein AOQ84DRAFT_376166 [Glonium stellatum]|uniref:Rhodopsin domain-containing protein n=1 Tax=Glonium stellatum TaxID=574774 RepID=A0A8E2F2H0_9PEZI|nr:hypothetical protein AOQ84DRAFT_376166 [Glonium stellatum]